MRRAAGLAPQRRATIAAPAAAPVAPFSLRHLAFLTPLVLLHLACALVFVTGMSAPALAVFAATALAQVFGITAGFHRLLAHRSFKTSRAFQFLLALLGVLAGQNGPLWWVGHHRLHHRHTDRDGDTHSPRTGFLWSHMGWLASPHCVAVRADLVRDLEALPELRLLERYYYLVPLCHAFALYLLGEAWHELAPEAATSGVQFVVWGSVASTVCVYHIVWSTNSICHRIGTQRFPTGDDSRNNFIVSLLTLGDGWHHNHHYWPTSARHGFRWWEIDLNYAILRTLERVHIVWDLRLPPVRLCA